MVALPNGHRLAEKAVIYWPELKGERFLISHNDPGPDIRNILLRHLAARQIILRSQHQEVTGDVMSCQGLPPQLRITPITMPIGA